MNLVLQAGTSPAETATPALLNQLLQALVQYMRVDVSDSQANGVSNLTGLIVSDIQPGVDDQDKIWAKLDATGRLSGFYYYLGSWKAAPLVIPSYVTTERPASPTANEFIFNATIGGFETYRNSAWTSALWARGPTSARPTGVGNGYLFFDETIQKLIRWVTASSAWTTVEGGLNEIKPFSAGTAESLITQWPGWVEYTDAAGRSLMGYDADHPVGSSGGRSSFSWRASKRGLAGSATSAVIRNVEIDSVNTNSLTGASSDVDNWSSSNTVDVQNPYRSVIFLRKNIH